MSDERTTITVTTGCAALGDGLADLVRENLPDDPDEVEVSQFWYEDQSFTERREHGDEHEVEQAEFGITYSKEQ